MPFIFAYAEEEGFKIHQCYYIRTLQDLPFFQRNKLDGLLDEFKNRERFSYTKMGKVYGNNMQNIIALYIRYAVYIFMK